MKKYKTGCLLLTCALGVIATSGTPNAAVPMIFQTTFNCADWDQSLGLLDVNVCGVGDGIAGSGAWTTSAGSRDQITAAANNPTGTGGKGFRHWRGDGYNNTGGGLNISLPVAVTNMWVRFHMRYQAGFNWVNGRPGGTKENYWNAGTGKAIYFGFGYGVLRFVANGNPYDSSISWTNIMGGSLGDGRWHYYEYHIQADTNGANGVGELWVDGAQVMNRTNINWNRGPWDHFQLGENQETPINGTDYYTDYDDIAVSTVGRIGPVNGTFTGGSPSGPTNLRIIP